MTPIQFVGSISQTILGFVATASHAHADATMVFPPSPYLGSFDSPFFTGIQAGTIYLEDFEDLEDGELNSPFVIANDAICGTLDSS